MNRCGCSVNGFVYEQVATSVIVLLSQLVILHDLPKLEISAY